MWSGLERKNWEVRWGFPRRGECNRKGKARGKAKGLIGRTG